MVQSVFLESVERTRSAHNMDLKLTGVTPSRVVALVSILVLLAILVVKLFYFKQKIELFVPTS